MSPFQRVVLNEGTVHVHESERLVFGFSELDFSVNALQRFFAPQPLLFLKQTHSARIVRAADWRAGAEGDGLLLDSPGLVAVVQTADCLPLFIANETLAVGGVVHVGWRGLCQGIENRLLEMLPGDLAGYSFFLGPAIEKKCYPVGDDVRLLFKAYPYAESIFFHQANGRYFMNLKAGATQSLILSGISPDRIHDCGLCTFCLPERFPSYRRDGKTGRRIYNFFAFRS